MIVEDGTAKGATHYQGKGDQPIEIMQNKMTHEQFIGFLRGNVIKYIIRIGCKDDDIKDAQKAAQYATWLCQALNGETVNPMAEQKETKCKNVERNCGTCKNNINGIYCKAGNCKTKDGLPNWIPKER